MNVEEAEEEEAETRHKVSVTLHNALHLHIESYYYREILTIFRRLHQKMHLLRFRFCKLMIIDHN